MDRRTVARLYLDDAPGEQSVTACHAAATLAGVSLSDAAVCRNQEQQCPRCPWKLNWVFNWRPQHEAPRIHQGARP